MAIADHRLPAVEHLAGDHARDVLGAAIGHAGGTLHEVRAAQVQYRPGSDIVIRYRADVTWPGQGRRDDTLFAAARTGGAFADAVPVVADTDAGPIEASIWRWPHDPVLPGLPVAVTASRLQQHLGDVDPVLAAPGLRVEVVAFRPTERAVIRATSDAGTRYVKVVAPAGLPALVDRHHRLGTAGLPVPPVTATDRPLGLLVLGELTGPTLRDRIKAHQAPWGDPASIDDLLRALRTVPTDDLPRAASRLRDALGHAVLLRTVAPESAEVLDRVTARIATRTDLDDRPDTFVHGDLHEAQFVVDGDGRVTGLLDIDDVGVGHRLADRSTLLGHLRFRAATAETAAHREAIDAFAARIRAGAPTEDLGELDLRTAAVLVGLATGPFRIQHDGWRDDVATVLRRADELSAEHEELLKSASPSLQDPTPG